MDRSARRVPGLVHDTEGAPSIGQGFVGSMTARRGALDRGLGVWAGATSGLLVLVLTLPVAALFVSSEPGELWAGVRSAAFGPALATSLTTTAWSLSFVVLTGTPLAWWLAHGRSHWVGPVGLLVNLPVVLPPAVLGLGLLLAWGRAGWLAPLWRALGWSLPFTPAAVVMAQVVVSAPFYVTAAANAFGQVGAPLLGTARALGASRLQALTRVALPMAWPGLAAGAALAWARALGEFGATLLFAGNLQGVTQTMPLAIYAALEADLAVARALALALGVVALAVGALVRLGPGALRGVMRGAGARR